MEIIYNPPPVIELNVNPVPIKGDKGDKGEQGIQGVKGDKGDTGDNGLSAYEVAVANGFVGTEAEWLASWKDRANHTGTQSISTIDNLQANLDLKAPKDSPSFTGQLVLPNNSRINNVEHFYQTTKPITRGDSSALVVGDRWWKIDTGEEWFWNGSYWLSTTRHTVIGSALASNSNSYIDTRGDLFLPSGGFIYVEKSFLVWDYAGYTPENYWTFQVNLALMPSFAILIIPTYNTPSGSGTYTTVHNTIYGGSFYDCIGIRLWAVRVGTPQFVRFAEGIFYREVFI